jgi:hypothetical protein
MDPAVLRLQLADPSDAAEGGLLARAVERVNRADAPPVALELDGSRATLTSATWAPMVRARVDDALQAEAGKRVAGERFRWV